MTSIAIIEAVNTTAVQFHGQPIITVMVAGVAYIAMRPIVENIGIDWSGQMAKLKNQRDKFGCRDISTPSKGGVQKMLCIPLRKLNGWLFSINPEKVRADIRDKLIQYQEECFAVLHEYWTKGEVTQKAKVRQATTKTYTITLTDEELCALCWVWNAAEYMREKIEMVYPALQTLGSEYAGSFYSMAFEYKRTLEAGRKVLDRETKSIVPHPHDVSSENWRRVLPHLRQNGLPLKNQKARQ